MGWNSKSSSFAARVRVAALDLGKGGAEFSAVALSDAIGIQDRAGGKRLTWVVRDFKRTGELLPGTKKGVYRLGERALASRPHKKQIMWRTLRGRRTVTVADLMEFAGVSRDYVGEWLRVLVRRGVVRRLPEGKYQLVQDSIEQPDDNAKAQRLRELRLQQALQVAESLARARNLADVLTDHVINLVSTLDEATKLWAFLERTEEQS